MHQHLITQINPSLALSPPRSTPDVKPPRYDETLPIFIEHAKQTLQKQTGPLGLLPNLQQNSSSRRSQNRQINPKLYILLILQ